MEVELDQGLPVFPWRESLKILSEPAGMEVTGDLVELSQPGFQSCHISWGMGAMLPSHLLQNLVYCACGSF